MIRSASRRRLVWVVVAVCALVLPRAARAQQPSGSTLSPDFQSYMVSKDLGNERWTINLNLFSTDPANIINVTGNIFRQDGGPASFVICLVRDDSNGSLRSPNSTFRLSCSGADACPTTAEDCARNSWTVINDDVLVPASFFLPPGGNGAESATASSLADTLIAQLSAALARVRSSALVRGAADLARTGSALAQSNGGRGATLTVDLLNHLVTKDVGNERWSISYSLEPVVTDQGGVENRFLSVTGNVFQSDGSPPSFVFCTQRDDSTGNLNDPNSVFAFRCQGTNACTSTASSCARNGWNLISDDVRLNASFFLPPGGLPAAPQSDPGIVVIGRTSDPPSIVGPGSESAASTSIDAPAASCPVGTACSVPRIGTCQNVAGVVTNDANGCRCLVRDVPAGCITCAGGTSGQCGGPCEYAVSDSTARGTCLPYNADSESCICYAIGAGAQLATQGCGGVTAVDCPGDRCCADDPRGTCDPLGNNVSCPGVCVAANGCDPGVEQCGICQPETAPTPTPTATPVETPTPGPTATPTASPSPAPSPTPCLGAGALCDGQPQPCCNGLTCEAPPTGERKVCVPIIP